MKIISGAQTGVDRAALDAAMELNIPCGGWRPQARKAEDGMISEKYPVKELAGADYRKRTRQNVIDSDGTVIIYFSYLSGGTEHTVLLCIKEQKPYFLIDADELTASRAAEKLQNFVKKYSVSVLNVAGPRASGEPKAYDYSKRMISKFIKIHQVQYE